MSGNIQSQSLTSLLAKKKEKNCKNTYLNGFIDTARVYTRFLAAGNLPYDPSILAYKFLKEEEFIKATMSDEEIEALLSLSPPTVCRSNGEGGKIFSYSYAPRNYQIWTVFFSIMAYTGMRPGEVAHLTVNDVDWGRDIFIVRGTKTNDFRLVPIAPNIKNLLKKHLEGIEDGFLFPSQRGGRRDGGEAVYDNVDWYYNFHQRIKRLGIKRQNLTPYSLRHSLITRLLEEDVNLFKVQRIVGHKRIDTTAHYTHLTTKDIAQAIAKHPLVRRQTEPEQMLMMLEEFIDKLDLAKDKRFRFEKIRTETSIQICVKIRK